MRTLQHLQRSSIDLMLVHWPVPGKHVDAYLELEACQRDGLVRSIGVSNYTIEVHVQRQETGSAGYGGWRMSFTRVFFSRVAWGNDV